MYSPQYSKDMYQNTACEESPVEVTALPPKPSRRCQKRMADVQIEDAPCCTPWTNKEEIVLCKAEFGIKFTLRHCWDVLKHNLKWWEQEVLNFLKPNASKRSKTSGSTSFNTESGDASFNLNVDAGDEDENEVQEVPRLIGRDKAKGSKKKGFSESFREDSTVEEQEIQVPTLKIKMNQRRQPTTKNIRTAKARNHNVFNGPLRKRLHCADLGFVYPKIALRTYHMINGKWKTMRLKVASFCGVYDNVFWMECSGANDGDYL
nr:hypothetical protein [Tanacetum cinerariifolium]